MKDQYVLTKEHFNIFEKECIKWQTLLGLNGWNVETYFEKDEDNCRATCEAQMADRFAAIVLSKTWDIKPTKKLLDMVAFHEMSELLLTKIDSMLRIHFNDAVINQELHTIIRTLENLLFDSHVKNIRKTK